MLKEFKLLKIKIRINISTFKLNILIFKFMNVIILAAGIGARMKNLTKKKPKCFLKINGTTLIERLVTQLKKEVLYKEKDTLLELISILQKNNCIKIGESQTTHFNSIPNILYKIQNSNLTMIVETNKEDKNLNDLFEILKWEVMSEEILLGRSIWKRNTGNKVIPGTKQLESMLGRLQPQQPPLPSPSLGKQ